MDPDAPCHVESHVAFEGGRVAGTREPWTERAVVAAEGSKILDADI